MAILSKYHLPVRVVDCHGLGNAQPGGIIIASRTHDNFPQKQFSYPRLKSIPKSVTIRWRTATQVDELSSAELRETDYQQKIDLPRKLIGVDAMLLFILDEHNSWTCELRNPNDPSKPYNSVADGRE